MSMSNKGRLLSLMAWAGLLALLSPLTLAATAPAAFLTVDPSEPTPHALSRPADASSRHQAQVDTNTLLSHDRVLLITHSGDELELRKRGVQHRGSNEFTWHGRVYQQQRHVGSATFTVQGQRIVGRIGTRDGRLRVQGDSGSHYWLDQIDPESIPQRHPSHEREDLLRDAPSHSPDTLVTTTGMTATANASADDEAARVDVIAYYTDAAIAQYTDEASMRLSIRNTVDMANTALIDSNVDHRFRLIGIIHWNHEESDQMVDSLFGLGQDSTVATLRNLYSADLNTGFGVYDDFCGIAFTLQQYDDSGNSAFSINNLANDYPCLEIQVVAHEMGHNLGLHHDPDNAPPPENIIEPFAYGHLSENEFNTIMAYHPGCGGGEYFNCFGSDFFSNPDVTDPESGLAVGIAQERDNAEVLRRTMPVGARWRQPPTSLASAAGLPDTPFRTEGHSPWVAQDQVQFNGRPSLVSGPVYGEEESRLVMSLDDLGIFDPVPRESIRFSVRNGSADISDGSLTVLADGIEIARVDDFSSEWTRHSFSLPDETEEITWVWQSDKRPSTEDGLGAIYLANTRLGFGSGSGGGCTLGTGQAADPSWLLLLLLSLLMKWRPYNAVSRQSTSTP
jgi:hypothetical protein